MDTRTVVVEKDRAALLEFHCQGNYESEAVWARTVPYADYRLKWLTTSQPESFLRAVSESMADPRTIAEVVEEEGEVVAWLWVTFSDIPEYGLTIAEVNDIAVAPQRRRRGLGLQLLEHAERLGRERGAAVLRSEVGIENVASLHLHEKALFGPFKTLYEKRLKE